MSKVRNDVFVPSSAYKAKQESQEKLMLSGLKAELSKELQSLKSDSFCDIDIYLARYQLRIKHRCILKICAPLLFEKVQQNIDCDLKNVDEEVKLEEVQPLCMIYGDNIENDTFDISYLLTDDTFSDVTLQVEEKMFKCHKCILSARSEFFSLMFRGSWMEREIDIIPLKDISAQSFEFVLSVMYGNVITIPKEADLSELLTISEMYNVNSLKRNLKFHLKNNYCHFFHIPCKFCIIGVIQTITLCEAYPSYEDLVNSSYNWFVKYYAKIFEKQQFSKSSQNVKENILKKIKLSVQVINVIQHINDCMQVKGRLPHVKSTDATRNLVSELECHCLKLICNNFQRLCCQPSFIFHLYDNNNVNKNQAMLECLVTGISKYINIDNCISVYDGIFDIENTTRKRLLDSDRTEAIENCEKFTSELKVVFQKYMRANFIRIQRTEQWKNLHAEVQKEIREQSGYI